MYVLRCLIPVILGAFFIEGVAAKPLKPEASATVNCEDTPVPDPVNQFESLPVHAKLAEQFSSTGKYHQIACQSKHFRYKATLDNNQLTIISYYKKNGHRHAEYRSVKNNRVSGTYRKHGVLRSSWPSGKTQAIEYFCDGFAVGFHQYFDTHGKLSYVVDYTDSDYEWQKRIQGWSYRDFYIGDSHLHGTSDLPSRTQLFREVYSVEQTVITRKAFATAGIFNPPWTPLDVSSTIGQWTKLGDQGLVIVNQHLVGVSNQDFDYLSFAEVYQRHKQKLPGLRRPESYYTDFLACPWIDEAMQLGFNDPRFKLAPIAAISGKERADSPEVRYAACFANPSADCLYEHALDNLRFEHSQKQTVMNGLGLAAVTTGHPQWARKAMTEVLAESRGFTLPNPVFAQSAMLKAEAEFALGLDQEANQSLIMAYQSAVTERKGYKGYWTQEAIKNVGPALAKE